MLTASLNIVDDQRIIIVELGIYILFHSIAKHSLVPPRCQALAVYTQIQREWTQRSRRYRKVAMNVSQG